MGRCVIFDPSQDLPDIERDGNHLAGIEFEGVTSENVLIAEASIWSIWPAPVSRWGIVAQLPMLILNVRTCSRSKQ
ncbi:hypothetical protein CAter282_2954 [Collimonas arenae]|uniref:Uncharacterized protein n=1 Tax=Collimonas arenae TaxID=279058 RepID=A0A127QL07_9BURK|nr:hypothetical protein CAter10_3248 [Collimonas arenae]AMP10676.1 hypothetical protein CAter282_2954 [Collimonas arenae]